MAKNDPLPEKYSKALALIKEGNLTYKQISIQCKINTSDFYDLIEGNRKDVPAIQEKFTSALNEINKQRDKEIRDLVKSNKKDTHIIIQKYLKDKLTVKNVDEKLISTITSVANALSKSTPNVEIGSLTYQKGLSPEDIYAEFKRLSGLTLDRGQIQAASKGGTGEIPVVIRPRTPIEEEPENPLL